MRTGKSRRSSTAGSSRSRSIATSVPISTATTSRQRRRSGSGGWPLTCFITPGGAPILIAGYMPPDAPANDPRGFGMTYVVGRIADAYASDPGGLTQAAREAAAKIAAAAASESGRHASAEALRNEILASMTATYDRRNGGFGLGPGPRFYDFPAIRLALAHGSTGHPDFTAMALDSLRKMAAGGVYDQLGGGFHRYSTDARDGGCRTSRRWPPTRRWRSRPTRRPTSRAATSIFARARILREIARLRQPHAARSENSYFLLASGRRFISRRRRQLLHVDRGGGRSRDEARTKHGSRSLYFGLTDDPARAPDGRIVLRRALTPDELAKRLQARTRRGRFAPDTGSRCDGRGARASSRAQGRSDACWSIATR